MALLRPGISALAAVVIALAGPGCGGSDEPARAAGGTLELAMGDYWYRPQSVRVTGRALRIDAVNHGAVGHNMKLRRNGKREFQRAAIPTLRPGERRTVTLRRLRSGTYTMLCTIPRHQELGQYGTLVVR